MSRSLDMIASVRLVVGLEVHVELATRTKVFARVASPAHASVGDVEPNTLIDPVVLALPGALPVLNKQAVEMSMMVGFALRCSIADLTKWDRKSYFYPDLPKAYQISQYDLPVCFDGSVDLPAVDDKGFPDLTKPSKRIGIIRAHLEEDAGKLLHEAPGGFAIDYSIADYNRAGTPLLEIVTQPDFDNADDVVLFAKLLRNVCRFLGVSEGVMQKGHMRFEPTSTACSRYATAAPSKPPSSKSKTSTASRASRAPSTPNCTTSPPAGCKTAAKWAQAPKSRAAGTTTPTAPSCSAKRKTRKTTATSPTPTSSR
jgi:aspartyl-tRNA(Asn)/glutamyl-tRNA(Gln) amidotransferase subunit B